MSPCNTNVHHHIKKSGYLKLGQFLHYIGPKIVQFHLDVCFSDMLDLKLSDICVSDCLIPRKETLSSSSAGAATPSKSPGNRSPGSFAHHGNRIGSGLLKRPFRLLSVNLPEEKVLV